MRTLILTLALSATTACPTLAQNTNLHWTAGPASLPPGTRMAIISGDPAKPGPFEIQLDLPAGFIVKPHFHPTAETQMVISGRIGHGMGDTVDATSVRWLRAGQSGTIPADVHHYAMTRGRTVLTMRSTGPFKVTYVNPADDPRMRK